MKRTWISRTILSLCVSLAPLLAQSGCASTYDTRYAFEPRPASVELRQRETEKVVTRTLVSVVGVRRASAEPTRRPAIEVRLRIENVSEDVVEFDPASLQLLSADLREFEPARVIGDGPPMIPPFTTRTFTAIFPFPPYASKEPYDVSSLTLRWTLLREGRPARSEQAFQRRLTPTVYRREVHRSSTRWYFHSGYRY